MSRKPMSRKLRNFIVGSAIAVVLCAVYIAWTIAGKSSADTIHVMQQPATAASVANQVGCTGFTDKGPSPVTGVSDSGTCSIAGVKYGVDTFAGQTERDSWIQMSAKFGITPKWQTATSVVYVSINQNV